MGLAGVVATQLWHQTYIDDSLAEVPSVVPLPRGAGRLRAALAGS
jgi:hypothetical protein